MTTPSHKTVAINQPRHSSIRSDSSDLRARCRRLAILHASGIVAFMAGTACAQMNTGGPGIWGPQTTSSSVPQVEDVLRGFVVWAIVAAVPWILFELFMLGARVLAILVPIAAGVAALFVQIPSHPLLALPVILWLVMLPTLLCLTWRWLAVMGQMKSRIAALEARLGGMQWDLDRVARGDWLRGQIEGIRARAGWCRPARHLRIR